VAESAPSQIAVNAKNDQLEKVVVSTATKSGDSIAETPNIKREILPEKRVAPEVKTGQYSYRIEQLAKGEGCRPSSLAELISKKNAVEYYKIECEGKESLVYRCLYQDCKTSD
jgi:hypothetical protein